MSNVNAQLDQVEIIKELKDLDSKILSKFSEIEKATTQAKWRIKRKLRRVRTRAKIAGRARTNAAPMRAMP